MNFAGNPALLEMMAASHALGTLRGGARRRFEAMARNDATVRVAALVWQSRLAGMAELQQPVTPDPAVWTRIRNLIDAEQQALALQRQRAPASTAPSAGSSAATTTATPGGWLRSLALWRGATAAGVMATMVAAVVGFNLREQLTKAPVIQYVAVLANDQSAASMLVTFDPKNRQLTLQRVGGYQVADDRSLQLWALPPGGAPRSLGVLGQENAMRLPATEADVRAVPALAISLEPRGGVPSERGPTGPVLFKGALIEKTL